MAVFLGVLAPHIHHQPERRADGKPDAQVEGVQAGHGVPHAAPIEVKKPSSFVEMSVPAAMRHASPMLVQKSPITT